MPAFSTYIGMNGGSSIGGIFSPTKLSNLTLWLRADLGITLNGSNVSQWDDQSPNNIHFTQGTAINQPAYYATGGKNSTATLRFNGLSAQKLVASSSVLSGLTAYTMFVSAKHTADGFSVSSTNDGIGDQAYSSGRYGRFYSSGYGYAYFAQGLSAEKYMRTIYDGSLVGNTERFKVYENGVQKTLTIPGFTVPASLPASTNIYIGDLYAGGYYMYGDVQEVIVYSRVLTADEITQVENYLIQRYAY